MSLPGPEKIRSSIRELHADEKKVLGGMIVVMIQNHAKIRDQEWIAASPPGALVGAHRTALVQSRADEQ